MNTGLRNCLLAATVINVGCYTVWASDLFSLFSRECGKKPSIAIIGAGIGGTSCAHFLTEYFGKDVYIDIFEALEVGGRLKSETFRGVGIELGGAVIHPRNKYMKSFVEKFGLETEPALEGRFGIYDGKEFVFLESGWSYIDTVKMMYRYGMISSWHLSKDIEYLLQRFDRIYRSLDRGYHFSSVDRMLFYMNNEIPGMRNITIEESFRDRYGDLMYEELILSIMRVNYGQGGNLHKFVGSVSLAGAMPDLWSVKGGNARVAEALLKASSALILNTPVYEVNYNNFEKKFTLSFPQSSDMDLPQAEKYDVVVIAAPLSKQSDHPLYFGPGINTDLLQPRQYHSTFVTIVEGFLDYNSFNCSVSPRPTQIFTPNPDLIFNSLSRMSKDDAKVEIWKIFSSNALDEYDLGTIFDDNHVVLWANEWHAYPEYTTPSRNDPFMVQPNLYYLNTIELAASAMEMSVVSAKNIALTIYKRWKASDAYKSEMFCEGPENFWQK